MSKNLKLQSKMMHEKKSQRKLKLENGNISNNNEYTKFTDRVIQDLQQKIKLTSSRPSALGHSEQKHHTNIGSFSSINNVNHGTP